MKSKSLLTVFMFFMFSMAWAQGFTISGTQLLDANGNNFIIKGVNVPLAWFVTDVNNNIAAINRKLRLKIRHKDATAADLNNILNTLKSTNEIIEYSVEKIYSLKTRQ